LTCVVTKVSKNLILMAQLELWLQIQFRILRIFSRFPENRACQDAFDCQLYRQRGWKTKSFLERTTPRRRWGYNSVAISVPLCSILLEIGPTILKYITLKTEKIKLNERSYLADKIRSNDSVTSIISDLMS